MTVIFASPDLRFDHSSAALPQYVPTADLLNAETADFHWDVRQNERHLGRYQSQDPDEGEELDCVAIIGWIGGHWFAATCIVDGDGNAHDLIGLRHFASAWDAEEAFACQR